MDEFDPAFQVARASATDSLRYDRPDRCSTTGDDVARVVPKFDRETVNRAGAALVRYFYTTYEPITSEIPLDEYERDIGIVNNWRSSHGYPLHAMYMNLRHTVQKAGGNAVVARRIKRLFSIAHKLHRFPKMKLTQMQDLGGCRAVMNSVDEVANGVEFFRAGSRQMHELATYDDYIGNPKPSGYRGAHLVFRYASQSKAHQVYGGLKIEMQIRSKYQHAWATAVETVGAFSGQALKSSLGSEDWQRFFTLMGSVIALRERCPVVPGTPAKRSELLAELAMYEQKLAVLDRLRGYRAAIKRLGSQSAGTYFLLELNPAAGTLDVTGFSAGQFEQASERYAEAETRARGTAGADAVLVSLDSVNELSRAYPNYFADTRVFIQLMEQALAGRSRGISVAPLAVPTSGELFPK